MAFEAFGNTGSGNEPMLTYHQWGLVAFIWGQFHKRYLSHHSLKLAWKLPKIKLKSPRGQWVKNELIKLAWYLLMVKQINREMHIHISYIIVYIFHTRFNMSVIMTESWIFYCLLVCPYVKIFLNKKVFLKRAIWAIFDLWNVAHQSQLKHCQSQLNC